MALSPYAASTLNLEARALLSRIARVKPFAMVMPRVPAAGITPTAAKAIDHYVLQGQRRLLDRAREYLRWLEGPGRAATPEEAQRRFSLLRLKFNAGLTQFDIFADALTLRAEHENGIWLAGLDVAATDALELSAPFFDPPPVVTYLDRGHGAAIRRARTRLPGGGENPVAIVRIPRERMVGSGIASSLVHEVGHQGAALLDLVDSLRLALQAKQRETQGDAKMAWGLWERWISEIVADFWAMAKVGIAATQGLMAVVSLPRAFVFRIQVDDPHPFPWVRVKLSAATGSVLYPHPQWASFDRLWESFYPRKDLGREQLRVIEALEATMPAFIRLLIEHRPKALRGKALGEVFPFRERQPAQLQALFEALRKQPEQMRRAAPTLVFAVLGQAKQDRKLGPGQESRLVGDLLNHWAVRRALRKPEVPMPKTKAKAA
jgi:hypothetical protein